MKYLIIIFYLFLTACTHSAIPPDMVLVPKETMFQVDKTQLQALINAYNTCKEEHEELGSKVEELQAFKEKHFF